MKILMINVLCGKGSTGRICTDIAVALEAKGHDVKIAYGRESVPEQYQKYAVRIGNDLDVKFHGVKARLFDEMGFGSKRHTEKFIEWVKKYDPDVIHLHNIHGYYINVEVLFNYLKTCGKKIVWTLHDCWAFTGHCAYCQTDQCEKWKTGCLSCPVYKSEYPVSLADRSKRNWIKKKALFTGLHNVTIITPSEWLAHKVRESYLGMYTVEVINNGIDTSVFKPVESDIKNRFGIADKKVILGVASVWDKRKGLNDFVRLSKNLPDEYKIVLVGLSVQQVKQIPAEILGIQRTDSVHELTEWYSCADLFVNPTYEDNYPTTNLEAIACGTPIIAYDTGGSSESAGNDAIIVKQGDIEGVINAIVAIKPKRAEKIPVEELDYRETVKKYESLYSIDCLRVKDT